MEYRKLGFSGLKVSELSFGSWVTFGKQVDIEAACLSLKYCLDQGINFFDNAEVYANGRSEEIMAESFRKLGVHRNEYVLTTKFFWGIEDRINFKNTLNRKYLRQAIEGSLKRLNTDFVDVVYCHRLDPETPLFEIVNTMSQMIDRGQALYWGTSEWPAQAIAQAANIAFEFGLHPPIVEQPQYNLLCRDKVETEFADLYDKIKLGLTTWSPLSSGVLTGKYLKEIPQNSRLGMPSMSWLKEDVLSPNNLIKTKALQSISQQSGISMSHLSIGWCLLNPHVSTVILGASNLEQLKQNIDTLKFMPQIRELKKQLDLV